MMLAAKVCTSALVRLATDSSRRTQSRMAALVKPNGLFGRLYMAGIAPFRYVIVYAAMTRRWERAWSDRNHYAQGR